MAELGISRSAANIFLPPYEWYNQTIADWASSMGSSLVNFTPGTRSNADYTTDGDKNYISSDAIMSRIRQYESEDPNGLNGFVLLTHIGSGPKRSDKFHDRIAELIEWLRAKDYQPVRIDDLLRR
jgi:hypothetical protein